MWKFGNKSRESRRGETAAAAAAEKSSVPRIPEPTPADERFALLHFKVTEIEVAEIWRQFEEAGFSPILIKGWAAAAQFYPEPHRRTFVDVDLMVAPGAYGEASKFAEKLQTRLPVDLHCGARHLDTLPFEELFSNSVLADCHGREVRLPRAEDHLRILCVHWLNDGGADAVKLWDIYYGVAGRGEDFDWGRLLGVVDQRRRRWVVCAIGLASRYLGLDLEGTPLSEEAKDLPRWLTRAVEREWRSGVRLLPLQFFLRDKKKLWEQIKKRLPPNPIQATVELEGDFDEGPRIVYQLRDIVLRVKPSVGRLRESLRKKRAARGGIGRGL